MERKASTLVFLSVLLALPVFAQTMEDKYTYKEPFRSAAEAFAMGMVDRHLTISCELEMQTTGETVVTNPAQCLKAAKELESVFEGQLMEKQVDQRIQDFFDTHRMHYPI